MSLPHYYSNLAPFQETFRGGTPVLTYHHIGRRRRGARLKGLYVSPKLFRRQVIELREAGFATPEFGTLVSRQHADGQERSVFLTFDDGFVDIFAHALPILQEQRCRGLVYLVSELLGKSNEWQQRAGDIVEPLMEEAQVRDWLAAGQEIGSHTQTHPRLTQLSPEKAREEITVSKKSLEDRFGRAIEHFCYPYGDWNERVRDMVIAAGYKSACTTTTGINTAETSPFELKRFTARYPSRSLKAIWRRLRGQ